MTEKEHKTISYISKQTSVQKKSRWWIEKQNEWYLRADLFPTIDNKMEKMKISH